MTNLYSVYDKKTERFSFPVAQENHESAKRWFKYVVKNSEMVAEDLQLYYVGVFDQEIGSVLGDSSNEFPREYSYPVLICSFEEVSENAQKEE